MKILFYEQSKTVQGMLGACTGGYKVYRDCVVRLTGAAKGMTGKRQGQGFLRASSVNEINIVFKKKTMTIEPFYS